MPTNEGETTLERYQREHNQYVARLEADLKAAKQRELELLAVIKIKHTALQAMVNSCSEHHCGLKIADDALIIEPSQALREHDDNLISKVCRETEEYFRCELSRFGNPYVNSVVLRHPDYDEVMQIIGTSPSPNGLHVVIKRN